MVRITVNGNERVYQTTEAAVEWLLEHCPESVVVNGHDISFDVDYDAYGVTLGAVEFALGQEG